MQHNFLILNGLTNMVVGSYGKAYCNTLYVHNRLVDLVVFSHIKRGQDLAEQTTDKSGTSPHGEIACPQWSRTLLQNVGLKRDSSIKAPHVYVCDYAHVFVLPLGCIFILTYIFGITFLISIFRHPISLCVLRKCNL